MRAVRVDDDTHDLLTQLAESEDRPMARIVRDSIDLYEQRRLAAAARANDLYELPANGQNRDDLVGKAATCAHPRESRKVFSWGAVCAVCGTVNP